MTQLADAQNVGATSIVVDANGTPSGVSNRNMQWVSDISDGGMALSLSTEMNL